MAVYKSKNETKDGRKYFFRIKYKDLFGVIHDYSSQKFKTLKEATNEEAIYKLKVQQNAICTNSVTFEQVINEYLLSKEKTTKKQTLLKNKVYAKYLEQLKPVKVNDFDITKYRLFKKMIEELNFTSEYSNRLQNFLKSIIVYSNKYYNTSDTIVKLFEPFKDVNKQKKELDFFTYEEYKKFDSIIDNFMHHVFFETLYFMGIRQGEAQALTWNDIDFEKKELNINKTLTTKIKGEKWTISTPKTKNSARVLPIPKNLLNDLKALKLEAQKFKDYEDSWFVFGNSTCFPETTIQKNKNKYCKLAKIKQIRVHDFRHSTASLLINKGASIALVSKYLGHSNISITLNTYTHMYKSELEQISNVLDNL